MGKYLQVGIYEAIVPGRTKKATYDYKVLVGENGQMAWKPVTDAPIVFPLYRHENGTEIPVLADNINPEDVLKIPAQIAEMTKGPILPLEKITEANRVSAQQVVSDSYVIALLFTPISPSSSSPHNSKSSH